MIEEMPIITCDFVEDEYNHLITEIEYLMSDFRYESLTHSRFEYIRNAIINGRRCHYETINRGVYEKPH